MAHLGRDGERVVAIVGGGPMATYALERLAALIPGLPSIGHLRVVVFERTGRFGAGEVHSDDQPQTNLLNRVVGEIAFGADETHTAVSALLPSDLRITFSAWCQSTWGRNGGTSFSDRDYAPRRVHGLALQDLFALYCGRLRSNGVTVDLYDAEVVDVAESTSARLKLMSNAPHVPFVEADHVLFVTGHSVNAVEPGDPPFALTSPNDNRYVRSIYPLDRNVTFDTAPIGGRVGLLGFGLSAIDAMLYLTEGRGGTFVETAQPNAPDGLRYQPSGREPSSIVVVTSTGLPLLARAENFKVGQDFGGAHQGVFLTHDTISLLRERHGLLTQFANGSKRRQIDFDCHVLPIIALEMAYIYYTILLGSKWRETLRARVRPAFDQFLSRPSVDPWVAIKTLVQPLEHTVRQQLKTEGGESRYPELVDWRALLDPNANLHMTTEETFCTRLKAQMVDDIAAALQGNLSNPLKAALDGVWRDLRGVIAAAADRGGLTAGSHRRFVRVHARTHNRLCNGPSVQAMRKVLALIRAELVDISIGPMPRIERPTAGGGFIVRGGLTKVAREVDVLMEARVHSFHAARDCRPLYPNLLRRGLVRLWSNPAPVPEASFTPGALDVDETYHPFRADGRVDKRMAFLGAPIDGLVHLQLSLARPGGNSSIPNLLNRWAEETFRMLMSSLETERGDVLGGGTAANELAQSAHANH